MAVAVPHVVQPLPSVDSTVLKFNRTHLNSEGVFKSGRLAMDDLVLRVLILQFV